MSDDREIITDEAALAEAEREAREAATTDDALAGGARPADPTEAWVAVATASSADPGRSLEPVYEALCEAGIPAGFDPYRPGVAASPYPFLQRAFHVVVPESRLADAQAALASMGVALPGERAHDDAGSVSRGGVAGAHHAAHDDTAIDPALRERRMSFTRTIVLAIVVLVLIAYAVSLLSSAIGPYIWR